jgi:pullulanase
MRGWKAGLRMGVLALAAALISVAALAQAEEAPELVVIPGTIQSVLGCDGDWQPDCEATALIFDEEDQLWSNTFTLPAGEYEYKAAINGSWDINYGLNAEPGGPNIPLVLTEETDVRFIYVPGSHWVTDSVNSIIANVPGSYQSELGCPEDWAPWCLQSLLQDIDGDGVYTFSTSALPPGAYEAKVAYNESWDLNYGDGGAQNGPNIPFAVAEADTETVFTYDSASHLMTITVGGEAASAAVQEPAPELVVIPGTIQSVLGCDGDWQPDCEATALIFDEEDQLWSNTFTLPAGEYEYKAAINGSWNVNYGLNAEPGGPNISLVLTEETDVRFIYVPGSHWVTDSVNSIIANVPGSYQSELGCPEDWAPWCLQSLLQDVDGDGVYTFSTSALPPGAYEAKVAYNESWELNYGDGGAQNGPNIPFAVAEADTQTVFTYDSASHRMTITVGGEAGPAIGSLFFQRAVWVSADTIAWQIARIPGATYRLHYSPTAQLTLTDAGVEGGDAILLTAERTRLPDDILADNPQLEDYTVLKLSEADIARVPELLRGQLALSMTYNNDNTLGDATGVQVWGVLDDVFATDAPLGVTWSDGSPSLSVWAPTAQNVQLHLFESSAPDAQAQVLSMQHDDASGVWSISGTPEWTGRYYLYEVTVYAPSEREVVTNLVTDPYSVSLAMNSARSQIIDLSDPALFPEGWAERTIPPLMAPEDAVLYELHVRDFSSRAQDVPAAERGTFAAFAEESAGAAHLRELAQAGVTHIHLLPAFDIATINEDAAQRTEPDRAALEALPPDSEEQQALVSAVRDDDAFNWGYDPLHFTVPEGSYSTDPDGPQRIIEFREMVMALNAMGLRPVMDVVYNHTNAAGQSSRAVLDRIVPGYYHRLNADGRVESSTCCANTATEHRMMERLMLDSLHVWVTQYGVQGFRFDLMGHHMRQNMLDVREMLNALTQEADGVDGASVLVYGEGWNFGEVANNARGVNATQINMAGTGIGTFNDRLRDAARGGNPFGGWQEQGFVTGLYTDSNEVETRGEATQLDRLLQFADQIRVGLAGNLRDYAFESATGEVVTGAEVDYNGQPAGYTLDPQEHIVYVSAHDNETIFDAIQFKAPLEADTEARTRMQNLANSIVMLSQGIPFFHAGDEMLRSKSLDRNSYNSGDWFNAIDWTMQDNNWGHGLPLEGDNGDRWDIMRPLLGDPNLAPTADDIRLCYAVFREWAEIRRSSPLFRLQTAEEISARLRFLNTGPDQIPGVIVMEISDTVGADLDPNASAIVVIFNAAPADVLFTEESLAGQGYALHAVQAQSADAVAQRSSYDARGAFLVPGRTTAVFVAPQG